jgi:histidine phosphotransferase ChpT
MSETAADSLLAELIASRLAHELVGPVGAIANGLELIEELGADAGGDAAALVGESVRQAGARLQFYRLAYGRAGLTVANLAPMRAAAVAFFEGQKNHDLSWPLPPVLPSYPGGTGRLLLLLTELGRDALIRGGTLSVILEEARVAVRLEGTEAVLPAALRAAVTGEAPPADIEPAAAHGALARAFALGLGARLTLFEEGGTPPAEIALEFGDQAHRA